MPLTGVGFSENADVDSLSHRERVGVRGSNKDFSTYTRPLGIVF
jgi:hypothetical protein